MRSRSTEYAKPLTPLCYFVKKYYGEAFKR